MKTLPTITAHRQRIRQKQMRRPLHASIRPFQKLLAVTIAPNRQVPEALLPFRTTSPPVLPMKTQSKMQAVRKPPERN
jgi:hypothetical protein